MAITPILKPLRLEGGTFYTFQPAMKDLTLMFGNDKNIQFNFSKFVCVKLPNWEQVTRQSMYIDPNNIESLNDNSELDDPNTFMVKAYLQNYAENLNTILDRNRDDNNFSNTSELAFFKSLSSKYHNTTPPFEVRNVGTYLDFNNVERVVYQENEESENYKPLIQYVGDINMINNVKSNGDEYMEVFGHIPTGAGKTIDVQFIQNLGIQPNFSQVPSENGEAWIDGQEDTYNNSTDKSYVKAVYDTNTNKYNVSTDKDLLQIDWNDLESPNSNYKFDNGDFEFNAILVYYDIFDKNDETTVSRNLYGILIIDSFDLSSPNVSTIKTFKKYQPNENQSGNGYGFRFNLMFSNSSNIVTTTNVINEDSTLSMELYMQALEVLKRVGMNSDELVNTAIDTDRRLNKMESIILSVQNATGEKGALVATQKANEATQKANEATHNISEKISVIDEAITQIQDLENVIEASETATNNANDAVQTINDKIGDVDTAINNANTATNNANNAVNNLSDKIVEVDTAINNANTATNNANNQRGWSPKFVFEEDGAQRLVKKLDSWIGGTGDAPTENVGMYVANGGYTSDISLAENFKGAQSDNLILEYVHSGNKEVYIDSIDYATNTFKSVGHGLVNGDRVFFCVEKVSFEGSNETQLDKYLPTGVDYKRLYHVVNATENDFQISISAGGSIVEFDEKDTIDFWFESRTIGYIYISNLPNINNVRTVFSGRVLSGTYIGPSQHTNPQNPHGTTSWTWKGNEINSSTAALTITTGIGTIESIVIKQGNMITISYKAITVNQEGIYTRTEEGVAVGYSPIYNGVVMGITGYGNGYVQNGDTLKVFKL